MPPTQTITKTPQRTKAAPVHGLKVLESDGQGSFEGYVAIFNNVDLQGDRILFGAFSESLREWDESGDPIPVFFSHQWDNPDALIGEVTEAEEVPPNDERLPEEIRSLGGLRVKGQIDLDEPFPFRIWKRMRKRLIKEFSFAFDILPDGARRADDGVTDLVKLGLIEVGPTLKGANPETVLVDAKGRKIDLDDDELEELETELALDAGEEPKAETPEKAKAWVTFDGSMEAHQAAVYDLVDGWARMTYGDNHYFTWLLATYQDRVVFMAERWEDPVGEGPTFEAAVTITADGDAEMVGEPTEVVIQAAPIPKATPPKAKESTTADGESATPSDRSASARPAKAKSDTLEEPEESRTEDPTGKGEKDRLLEDIELDADLAGL